MDYRELVNLGLSEKEARVYLAALELGKSAVQKISQKAGVNRATTYVIIEGLMKKGLMSSATEDKKQYFYAETPEKLSLLFKIQEAELKNKQEGLQKLLPNLKAISNIAEEKPVVRYFVGKEGLKSISEELSANKGEPVRMAYSQDLIESVFSKEERTIMRKKRMAKKIKTKVLYNYKNQELPSTPDGERQKISEANFPIFCDIAIFGRDKVRIAALQKKIIGLIIENKEMHDSLKSIFDLAWIGAKYLEKKSRKR
jgi:sugar-specific transcriptional regulator TrmB